MQPPSPPDSRRVEMQVLAETGPMCARRAVRDLLRTEGEPFVADALLLTSELVTNAMVHTAGACTLTGLFDPHCGVLRIEVSDESVVLPVFAPSGRPQDIGGHGLYLVDRIANRWGTTPTSWGKTIWFEIGS